MAEEKKYEITISDLSAYIGAAAFEILPEDAKEEDVDKYAMVAAGITDRVAKHLDGSDPLPEDVEDPNAFQTKLINSNRYVSCDYGTQNATVFLLWNKGTDGVWYCTREYYYSGRDKGRQKTDAEYAKDLESWLDGTEIKAVIVDPAAASFIAELRKRGFRVIKAKNDVEDGIRLVSTKLNLIKIIFSNVCQNTIKEFASYIWDAKAAERGEDKPIKQYDHAMDAVRYFVYTIFGDKPRLNRNLKGGL